MVKFAFVLAFLLVAIAAVEKASAAPTFCTLGDDGVLICVDDTYFDGPGLIANPDDRREYRCRCRVPAQDRTEPTVHLWVGNLYTNGTLSTQPVAPGGGFFFVSSRIGDYSTAVLDPSDNRTFWAANEYIGPNGGSDIWRTHITSFSAKPVPQLSSVPHSRNYPRTGIGSPPEGAVGNGSMLLLKRDRRKSEIRRREKTGTVIHDFDKMNRRAGCCGANAT
jgi:hypothetical protein